MQNNFDLSLKYVLQDEGGNSDDPRDHGGRTSRGITQREYDAWCNHNGMPLEDVWKAADASIHRVYREQYWNPYCDQLPSGIDYLFFDMNVNAGLNRAVRILQKSLGVNIDGMLGQVTLNAAKQADIKQLIAAYSENRRDFYRHLKQFNIYGRGWLRRVDRAEINAQALVTGVSPTPTVTPTPKATDPDTPSVTPGQAGTATGGLLAILAGFKDELQNLSNYIPNLNYAILGIAVVGLGYTLYSMWKHNKISQVL